MDRAVREAMREERAFRSAALEVWLAAAERVRNPYTDPLARRTVKYQAVQALRDADGLVVLRAIERRMDGKSSPRRIPEWARLEAAEQREREHTLRMLREREVKRRPASGLHRLRVERTDP